MVIVTTFGRRVCARKINGFQYRFSYPIKIDYYYSTINAKSTNRSVKLDVSRIGVEYNRVHSTIENC